MSGLVDRITAVLRKHVSAQTENWETKLRCECGQGDFTTKLEYAQHVSERVAAELQLTEERHTYADYETKAVMGGEGVMQYGGQTSRYLGMKTKRRWVSAWSEVTS